MTRTREVLIAELEYLIRTRLDNGLYRELLAELRKPAEPQEPTLAEALRLMTTLADTSHDACEIVVYCTGDIRTGWQVPGQDWPRSFTDSSYPDELLAALRVEAERVRVKPPEPRRPDANTPIGTPVKGRNSDTDPYENGSWGGFATNGSHNCRLLIPRSPASLGLYDTRFFRDVILADEPEPSAPEQPPAKEPVCEFCHGLGYHETGCMARRQEESWTCTREKGHAGPHVACNSSEHNVFRWEQPPAAPWHYPPATKWKHNQRTWMRLSNRSKWYLRASADLFFDSAECQYARPDPDHPDVPPPDDWTPQTEPGPACGETK